MKPRFELRNGFLTLEVNVNDIVNRLAAERAERRAAIRRRVEEEVQAELGPAAEQAKQRHEEAVAKLAEVEGQLADARAARDEAVRNPDVAADDLDQHYVTVGRLEREHGVLTHREPILRHEREKCDAAMLTEINSRVTPLLNADFREHCVEDPASVDALFDAVRERAADAIRATLELRWEHMRQREEHEAAVMAAYERARGMTQKPQTIGEPTGPGITKLHDSSLTASPVQSGTRQIYSV
jgi:hypothetical protein